MGYIFLLAMVSVGLSVAAQFVLKAGMASEAVRSALLQPLGLNTVLAVGTNGLVVAGFALYGLGAVVWLTVLSRWEVSKAYPLVGFGFVLSVLVGLFMGEQVGLNRLIGVSLIAVGVWLVANS